jgi:asparagine synthase (glutamine-hydrolysing)
LVEISARIDWNDDSHPEQFKDPYRFGHVTVVADARIDNFDELKLLLGLGPEVSVDELLVHAYLAWDDRLCEKLTGDFAFVIWDGRERRLLAARDPFGVRPLFYRGCGNLLLFASRIDPLVKAFVGSPRLDDQRVVEYLLGVYTAPERTFFEEIREVLPGTISVVSAARSYERCYWTPRVTEAHPTGTKIEYMAEFRRLFLQSVERRLSTIGPVTIHVSGGLDSSAIACAANVVMLNSGSAKYLLRGVAATYPGLECDESIYVDAVARQVSFPIDRWDETQTKPTDLITPSTEEPGIRTIFRGGTAGDIEIAAQNGSTVILSGLGGDQLGTVEGVIKDLILGGEWSQAIDELLFFPGATLRSRAKRIARVLTQFRPNARRLKNFSRRKFPAWLTPEMRDVARGAAEWEAQSLPAQFSNLQRYTWKRLHSVETLRNISIMNVHSSMHGIEYRFPFLDKDLISFTLSIPGRYWPRPGPFARLHREALRDEMPEKIVTRFGKAEFTSAIIKKVINSTDNIKGLLKGSWASTRYVSQREARRFCRDVLGNPQSDSRAWRQVWAMATFEAWMRGNSAYDAAQKGN